MRNYDNIPSYTPFRLHSGGPLDQLIKAAWDACTIQGRGPKRVIIHRSIALETVKSEHPIDHLAHGGPQPYEIWLEVAR